MIPDLDFLRIVNPGVFSEVITRNGYGLTEGCFKDCLVVDAGAHVGNFSYSAKIIGQAATIVAVEPNPVNFAKLSRVFSRCPEYILWNKAFSHDFSPVLVSNDDNSSRVGQQGTPVDAMPLGEIPRLFPSFRSRAALKMDIEGSEYNVLWSAPREVVTFFKSIYLETHGEEVLTLAMIEYLKCFGFRMTRNDRMFSWDVLPGGGTTNWQPLPAWVLTFHL